MLFWNSCNFTVYALGVGGLFRGWIPLLLETPSYTVYFSVTEISRQFLQESLHKMKFLNAYSIDAIQSFLSSLLANAISLIPWVPCELITTQLATQDIGGINALSVLKDIYRKDGMMGFMKGYGSSLASHGLYSFEWWATYSIIRRELIKLKFDESHPLMYDMIPGVIAGLVSGVLSHPIDTFKTKIMAGTLSQDNVISTFMNMVTTEGIGSLYGGLSASLVSGAISSGIFCLTYEYIKNQSISKTMHSKGVSVDMGGGLWEYYLRYEHSYMTCDASSTETKASLSRKTMLLAF